MANIEELVNQPYKYGFSTEIPTENFPPGLSEELIHRLSERKEEPSFLLDFRLRAYKKWKKMTNPVWAELVYPTINYSDIVYYSVPVTVKKKQSLEEIDPELRKTFEKLQVTTMQFWQTKGVRSSVNSP